MERRGTNGDDDGNREGGEEEPLSREVWDMVSHVWPRRWTISHSKWCCASR